MTRSFDGALHLHSTFSDGEYSLAELREIYLKAGCSFVCLTDHAEAFSPARRDNYVAECLDLSDERFLMLPGLEYNCTDRMHVLGYGVTDLLTSTDPQEVIAAIQARGGLSVIAHPKDTHFPWIESFSQLPCGLETWNSKYDGRYAPRPRTFDLLLRLRQRRPTMQAYYGQDLHWRHQYRGLLTRVRCDRLDRGHVMGGLASGDYVGKHAGLTLSPSGRLPQGLRTRFDTVNHCSHAFRKTVRRVKGLMARCGATLPAPIKARLRSIF